LCDTAAKLGRGTEDRDVRVAGQSDPILREWCMFLS
jgi:hypothetical protein